MLVYSFRARIFDSITKSCQGISAFCYEVCDAGSRALRQEIIPARKQFLTLRPETERDQKTEIERDDL